MRLMLEEDLAGCETLAELQAQTIATLSELALQGYGIEYVAGPISADGDEYIDRNLRRLIAARNRLSSESSPMTKIFTAPFIFVPEWDIPVDNLPTTYERLGLFKLPKGERERALQGFWRGLIMAKVNDRPLIQRIHFMSRWRSSEGTTHEHEDAQAAGVAINYLDSSYDELELRSHLGL